MWSLTHSLAVYLMRAARMAAMHEMVTTDEQYHAIGRCHNSMVGHHGVERTVTKMRKAGFTWPYIREHVRNFIRGCPCCQKMSYLRVPIIARTSIHDDSSWAYGSFEY